ncbi:MAG: hypothetical protein AAF726_07550 [Planctomycetota bacterium]
MRRFILRPVPSSGSLLLAAALSACTGGGGGANDSGGTPGPSSSPLQFQPSEPGLLVANPARLTLGVGQAGTFDVDLYDSLGGLIDANPDVMWTSETPEIALVDGGGAIDARAEGTAVIAATDGGRRVANVIVEVVPTNAASDDPIAIRFDPPVLTLVAGNAGAPSYSLTNAVGSTVPAPSSLRFVSDGESVSVDPLTGAISALGEGLASVRAVLVENDEATPLDGQLLVLILDGDEPMEPPGCDWEIVDGDFYGPPTLYSMPGLAAELRTLVYEQKRCVNTGPTTINGVEIRVRQMAPQRVSIAEPGVARIDAGGLLASVAPGRTRVVGILDRADGSQVEVPGFMVTVLPRLGGRWRLDAANGDSGVIELPATPAIVEKRADVLSVDGTLGFMNGAPLPTASTIRLRGTGAFFAGSSFPLCDADAAIRCSSLLIADIFDLSGACSENQPGRLRASSAPFITYCAEDRHAPQFGGLTQWSCIGPNTIRGDNGVRLTRADGPMPIEEFGSVRVNGTLLESSDPGATLSDSGQLRFGFYRNGDESDFGVVFSLDGIPTPGTYTLTGVGSLDSDATGFAVYGRVDPPVAFSSGASHPIQLVVEQSDETSLRATFSGTAMDLLTFEPDVTLSQGSIQVRIEPEDFGTASFSIDGTAFEVEEPIYNWIDGTVFVTLLEPSNPNGWYLAIELTDVTGPGTYVANVPFDGDAVVLARMEPISESYATQGGQIVNVTIHEIDESHLRASFGGTVMRDAFSLGPLSRSVSGDLDIRR